MELVAYFARHAARRPAVPGGIGRLLVSFVVAAALAALFGLPGAAAMDGDAAPMPVLAIRYGPTELATCDLTNVVADRRGLALGPAPFRSAAYADATRFGLCVSAPIVAPEPFDRVGGGLTSSGGGATLEVRGSGDGSEWSPWQELADAGGPPVALPEPATILQYRVTLLEQAGSDVLVSGVALDLARGGPRLQALALSADSSDKGPHPSVRVFATREGLVGRPTANGHVIEPHDHFAALPSKSVLNPRDGTDYQVKVSYRGRSATVPIWDIGPWNVRDDYWSPRRDLFGDLQRYLPEALAAWRDGYNGGRDQFGRWVTFPASIDLADGTYWDDLKMGVADWVDVTFLWVTDKSPAPQPTANVFFKPAPGEEQGASPPPLGTVWYFAEGSTNPPFDSWLLIQNPSDQPARVTLTLMKTDGTTELRELVLPPTSRTSLSMNDMLPNSEFSTRLDATAPVYAERAVYFRHDGHVSAGIPAPAKTWYLAEGSTQDPFDTWILLQNPGQQAASITVTFMTEQGIAKVVPMTVWPTSRLSLYANAVMPNASFSTKIVSDQPLVVEHTTYMHTPSGGGEGAPGVSTPSKTWYFAEGNTRPGLDTWLLLMNPNDGPTAATVTFYQEDGTTLVRSFAIGPNARFSLNAHAALDGARFGMKVEADRPIVAERSMYFGDDGAGGHTGAHDSVGSPILAKTWFLPDGSTHAAFWENILICNPNEGPANVTLRFMKPDSSVVEKTLVVPPTSRLTVSANALAPDEDVSTEVDSDVPVVAERSLYFADMQGGTNSIGIPAP